jgi:hypothetical protein
MMKENVPPTQKQMGNESRQVLESLNVVWQVQSNSAHSDTPQRQDEIDNKNTMLLNYLDKMKRRSLLLRL